MDVTVPTRELADDGKPRPGETFANRYRIERKLGEGGFGEVFAARDRQLEREVAIKVLAAATDATLLARFLQEARTIAALDSEHVVTVHEVAASGHTPYIVMERLHGRDLAALLRERGPLPVEVAIDYVLQAVLGIAHAHARGIVHRDLKPRNLFLAERADGSRVVKVLDFGIAKAERSELTESGAALGTTRFMAPEQLRSSRTVDARTDIWALGAVLYELVANQPAFDGGSAAEIGIAILTDAHVPLRDRVPAASPELSATVDRCLAKDPDARFADVGELARALGASEDRASRIARALQAGSATDETRPLPEHAGGGATRVAAPERDRGSAREVHDRDMRRRWLVFGSLLLGLGGVAFGIAMALRSPAIERILVTVDAAVATSSADAPTPRAEDATALVAATPDAAIVAADAGGVAIADAGRPDARLAIRRPDAGVRAPKETPAAEIELIQKQCNYERVSVPWFLTPGSPGGAYGCRQIALLGCAGVASECAKFAVTDAEKMTCRNFLLKLRARGCR